MNRRVSALRSPRPILCISCWCSGSSSSRKSRRFTAGAVFFGIGIGFMYVMVLLSFKPMATTRPKLWHVLMFARLEYSNTPF